MQVSSQNRICDGSSPFLPKKDELRATPRFCFKRLSMEPRPPNIQLIPFVDIIQYGLDEASKHSFLQSCGQANM